MILEVIAIHLGQPIRRTGGRLQDCQLEPDGSVSLQTEFCLDSISIDLKQLPFDENFRFDLFHAEACFPSNWFPNSGLSRLTTVEEVSGLKLVTLLEEHSRDEELANPWKEEFHRR